MPPPAGRWGWVLAGAAVGSLAGGLAVAAVHPRLDDSPLAHATTVIPVTAPVEMRPVDGVPPFAGSVSEGSVVALTPALPGSMVVTEQRLAAGDTFDLCSIVAEVNGQALLALPRTLPLYRDIAVGDEGNDVRLLEVVLAGCGVFAGTPDDTATIETQDAVRDLYARSKSRPPKAVVLALANVVQGSPGAPVVASAEVGDHLGADTPLFGVQDQAPAVVARADALRAQQLPVGASVALRTPQGLTAQGTVATVSAFREASPGQPPGYDITVPLPAEWALPPAAQVTISVPGTEPPQPAVPLTAVRQDGGKTYVLVVDPAARAPTRVDVVVVAQSEGYAVLDEGPLRAGMTVVVRS